MDRQLFITEDGSHSIIIPELNVSYHSRHGAIQESTHIFIEAGLRHVAGTLQNISILEVGFGTGLNGLLTLIESKKYDLQILYDVVELYPLDSVQVASLNYLSLLGATDLASEFSHMHACEYGNAVLISKNFQLQKFQADILDVTLSGQYDVVYFDLFDPSVQPELWSVRVFKKIYDVMKSGAVLVTYCSKGEVRRAMEEAGLQVEKLRGPRGKREIVRAHSNAGSS
jgi:tRNA U34 5-methylaminomethyl-2-thiouridine-forming methyltransferase MnmC